MNFTHSAILFSLGLGVLGLTSSCGTDDPDPATGPAVTCVTDYSTLASEPPVSFRTDIIPIFGFGCAGASACHDSDLPKAKLYLGEKCPSDPTAKWKCTFPPGVVTEAVVDQVHAAVMAMSATAPAVPLVVAGNPEGSFLMDKIADKQNSKGYACTTQDTSALGVCGDLMPLNSSLCGPKASETSRLKYNAIATWIAQGALKN